MTDIVKVAVCIQLIEPHDLSKDTAEDPLGVELLPHGLEPGDVLISVSDDSTHYTDWYSHLGQCS